MSNHDDFLDEYIEYRIFEESMNESGDKPSKHGKRGSGCGTTAIIIVLVIIVLCVFGSCGSNKKKSSSSGSYKSSYNTSSYSSTAKSSGSGKSSYETRRSLFEQRFGKARGRYGKTISFQIEK